MTHLTASIVLCTCQGERFLPEQLASLRAQTRAPMEVIAQDDASTDGTFALLEREAKLAPYPFLPRRNSTRLGFAGNFGSALALARGDVLFFCDQDDVWETDKVASLLARFEANPALLVACGEATKIDEKGQRLPGLVLAGNGLGPVESVGFARPGGALPRLVSKNPIPGMTMAFRASVRDRALPVPPGWEHDYWVLLVAAGLGGPFAVEERPLARYRQHGGQVIGGERSFLERWTRAEGQSLADRRMEANRWVFLGERLSDAPLEVRALFEAKRAHLLRRSVFSRYRLPRAVAIAGELLRGGYHRFDAGLSSALKDLLSSSPG